jgi:hypothetical protein
MPNRITLAAAAGLGLAGAVNADVIIHQPYDNIMSGRVAQDFPDVPQFSTYHFDDFTLDQEYELGLLTAPGFELFGGDPTLNISVIAQITSEPSILAEPILRSEIGSEDELEQMVVDFRGQRLGPGTYWIAVWVERTYNPGGQWFWGTCETVSGSEPWHHNPGGAFGFGTEPIPASWVAQEFADLAFTLEGQAVGCEFDCTEDGALDLFDFLCFVNLFNADDDAADCTGDGFLDLFDFLCFVNGFNAGC